MTIPNVEWQQFDDHQAAEWIGSTNQAASDEHDVTTEHQSQDRATLHKFFELIFAIVFVYGLVGLFIWQQNTRRIADLEEKMALLQAQPTATTVVSARGVATADTTVVALGNPTIKPQWRALMEMIEVHLHLAYGHELDGNLRQRLVDSTADVTAYSLELALIPEGQARWQEELAMHAPGYQLPNPQHAVANSLVEFILADYGTVKLMALLDTFTHHEDWDTLVPALFSLSVTEFEEAWQQYVQQETADDPVVQP